MGSTTVFHFAPQDNDFDNDIPHIPLAGFHETLGERVWENARKAAEELELKLVGPFL